MTVKDAITMETRSRSFFSGMLPFFVLAHFSHHLLTALPTPLLPFIRKEFSLDYTQSALVLSAFSLSYGIGQVPAGWLADRIGPRILITMGICGVAVAGILIGLSQAYIMMIIFLVLMGLAGGGYHPAAAPLISASVEPENRGRALGFHVIGGSGSFFLAPIIAASIAAAWGWRSSFLGLALPAVAFGILFYVLLGRRGRISHQVVQEKNGHYEEKPPAPGTLRRLVAFMIMTVFSGGVMASSMSFVPLYMVDQFGVSEETAAKYLAIVFSAGLWAGPLGGYLSDRLGRVPIILATSFFAGIVVYLLNLVPYGWGIGALLFVFGIIIFIRMPVSEAFIIGQTSIGHRSTVYGIYYFTMQEAGAIFAPILGHLFDHLGFYSGFTIASVTAITVTFICSFFLWGSKD
jgi:MFS family permease